MVKNLQIGEIYFYQGYAGCLFVKVIKKCGNRFLVLSAINATYLKNIEYLETALEYERYREEGDLMGIWTVEERFLLQSILIPLDKLPESRTRILGKKRISNDMVIPLAMDKQEKEAFIREEKINSVIYD